MDNKTDTSGEVESGGFVSVPSETAGDGLTLKIEQQPHPALHSEQTIEIAT